MLTGLVVGMAWLLRPERSLAAPSAPPQTATASPARRRHWLQTPLLGALVAVPWLTAELAIQLSVARVQELAHTAVPSDVAPLAIPGPGFSDPAYPKIALGREKLSKWTDEEGWQHWRPHRALGQSSCTSLFSGLSPMVGVVPDRSSTVRELTCVILGANLSSRGHRSDLPFGLKGAVGSLRSRPCFVTRSPLVFPGPLGNAKFRWRCQSIGLTSTLHALHVVMSSARWELGYGIEPGVFEGSLEERSRRFQKYVDKLPSGSVSIAAPAEHLAKEVLWLGQHARGRKVSLYFDELSETKAPNRRVLDPAQ